MVDLLEQEVIQSIDQKLNYLMKNYITYQIENGYTFFNFYYNKRALVNRELRQLYGVFRIKIDNRRFTMKNRRNLIKEIINSYMEEVL